jgi:hypothetical protein
MSVNGMSEEQFLAWLQASCDASGVPLKVSDPIAIRNVAILLGAPPVQG